MDPFAFDETFQEREDRIRPMHEGRGINRAVLSALLGLIILALLCYLLFATEVFKR